MITEEDEFWKNLWGIAKPYIVETKGVDDETVERVLEGLKEFWYKVGFCLGFVKGVMDAFYSPTQRPLELRKKEGPPL